MAGSYQRVQIAIFLLMLRQNMTPKRYALTPSLTLPRSPRQRKYVSEDVKMGRHQHILTYFVSGWL